jgi:NAD(P)-dependent dehydrogenase (short-subunit alcohol dehydrogenase family)
MDTEQKLAGKVALVTGSSRGIGRAVAQRLASAGATVIVTGRSAGAPVPITRSGQNQLMPGTLEETVALIEAGGGKAIAIAADLENDAERDGLIDRAAEAAGGLDILVNNAGLVEHARVEDMTLTSFDRMVTHHLRAPFRLAQAAIPHMRKRGAGWIVNIGSVVAYPPVRPYGDYARMGGDAAYAAVKAGIHRFTQALAAEMVDHNIAANVVGPSTAIRTPGADMFIPEGYPTEDVEYLAETVLAMCHLPAAERTGLVAFSMHYPWHANLQVMSLDGTTAFPRREPPATSHPATSADGL